MLIQIGVDSNIDLNQSKHRLKFLGKYKALEKLSIISLLLFICCVFFCQDVPVRWTSC